MEERGNLTPLAVGFDLDMTTVNARPGIRRRYDVLSTKVSIRIDSDLIVSLVGPPVAIRTAEPAPAEAERYRAIHAELSVEDSIACGETKALMATTRPRGLELSGRGEGRLRSGAALTELLVDRVSPSAA